MMEVMILKRLFFIKNRYGDDHMSVEAGKVNASTWNRSEGSTTILSIISSGLKGEL